MSESPLQELLRRRRTNRAFAERPLSRDDLGSLLWAACGETGDGHRTSPSAHALQLVTVSVVDEEHRAGAAATSLVDEDWLRTAAVLLLLSADLSAANEHFADQPPLGRRGERYAWLEAGHISQNVYLRATEMGLGVAFVAGLDDDALLRHEPPVVPDGHHPLGLIAVGHPV